MTDTAPINTSSEFAHASERRNRARSAIMAALLTATQPRSLAEIFASVSTISFDWGSRPDPKNPVPNVFYSAADRLLQEGQLVRSGKHPIRYQLTNATGMRHTTNGAVPILDIGTAFRTIAESYQQIEQALC